MTEKIKNIDLKSLIERETGKTFNKSNMLSECPFCGSGKGSNGTPGFNVKKNFFRCFSCSKNGSTIDFMMFLNDGWKERHAIKYLSENYLNETVTRQEQPVLTAFQKTLYAITKNSNKEAEKYLKSRNINIQLLPSASFYYDSLKDAVVFTDSMKKLLNRRFINPKKGQPKAKNQGSLFGSIYSELFNPDKDTVYIHEGVINCMSMPEYSSVAVFSSQNKIDNIEKLNVYVQDKHVILAFDNDKSGNDCTVYYKEFLISKGFDVRSISKLVLPEKTDTNDLLCSGELESFLESKDNYKLLWEDIIRKPLPTESENKNSANEAYYFYSEDGCYHTRELIRNKPVVKKLSNFVMESVYHLTDGTKESRRLIKFQRNTGELVVKEILSSEFALERFKRIIRSISARGLSFYGNTINLDFILTYLYDRELNAKAVNRLGYQQDTKAYCFANALITEENNVLYPDKLGIVTYKNTAYYLAPFSFTNKDNEQYEDERKFTFKEGELDFEQWSKLIYTAYGTNAAIGISFIILSLFRDYIIKLTGFFPFLFLFGDQGGGKSHFINFFLGLFGEPNTGISLLNSTDKGFARSLSQRKNALLYLKEYSNALPPNCTNIFKVAYDGELYTMAQKTNDNKTKSLQVTSACMIDGNELPTSQAALFVRMLVLMFEENTFTPEMTEAFNTLYNHKDKGFCSVTREIFKHRKFIETRFKSCFDHVFQQVKNVLTKSTNISDRQLKHIALLLTPVKLLSGKLKFPFSYEYFEDIVVENAQCQNDMASELKDISIFWSAIAFKANEGYDELCEGKHYHKDPVRNILYIKFKSVYPYYVDYARKNNHNILSEVSLRELLTSKGNKWFIPNLSQKSRSGKTYTHKTFGCCYQFKFERLQTHDGIQIDGVEINI